MQELTPEIKAQIEAAADVLRRGGLAAYPTDTVYGLGARGDDTAAIRRVFELKIRPSDQALPLLIGDLSQLTTVARTVSPLAERLIERFWPGALTLVLLKNAALPDAVTGGGDSVAVRLPGHPVPRVLATVLGVPVVGTSANLSGMPSALTADEVKAQLGDRVDCIIDGGRVSGGVESTVLDLTGAVPRILREGAVSRLEIAEIVPQLG
jgi:L-threonylcarbamoyladenylate synthase